MKRLLLLMLSLTMTLTVAVAQRHEQPTDAHIFGDVVDAATGEHIPYATVVLLHTTIGTTTDATGHFLLKNLPLADYTVEVRAVGYAAQRQEVCLHGRGTVELRFEVVEEVVAVDQVVVSASRTERLKREAPSLVSVLDSELFDRVSTASLGGGLSYQPGVRVENTCQNCGFPQVRINGLDGRYSQILVDSHPLFSALTGVYGLEQIPANMIERVGCCAVVARPSTDRRPSVARST